MQWRLRRPAAQLVNVCQQRPASGKHCALIKENGFFEGLPGHLDEKHGVALHVDAHWKEFRGGQWIDRLFARQPRPSRVSEHMYQRWANRRQFPVIKVNDPMPAPLWVRFAATDGSHASSQGWPLGVNESRRTGELVIRTLSVRGVCGRSMHATGHALSAIALLHDPLGGDNDDANVPIRLRDATAHLDPCVRSPTRWFPRAGPPAIGSARPRSGARAAGKKSPGTRWP